MLKNGFKMIGIFVVAMMFVAGGSLTAFALNHGGTIGVDETWRMADNPHIVTADIFVQNSGVRPTLTIEPGCIVKFNAGFSLRIGYSYHGRLIAKGIGSKKITFTSNQPSPAPGDWDEIEFRIDPSGSIMRNCIVEYGGGGSGNAANIILYNQAGVTDVKIEYCTIKNSADYGVRLDGTTTKPLSSFKNNKINGCGLNPVSVHGDFVSCLGTGNTYSGNNPDCIMVISDTVTTTQTWLDQGVPYCLTGYLYVQDSTNEPVLTLNPGVTCYMPPSSEIRVGQSYPGALKAVGTAAKPITFTSSIKPGFNGDWLGIRFYDKSIDAQNKMVRCVVEHGGGNGYGNLYLDDCSVDIRNSKFRQSGSDGIYFAERRVPI